ncbi:MAG: 6-phosphogluconate dehydrogenase (decarboxylating) [Spirochaetes bacterium GWB1_66_5]|nr:MAG: 6-phosphogluconate dehydrogenase (decarboxylating) [Spirochaetes bacterium GWB1_66_5]
MQIGIIGLGKMGGNMARRLAAAGHRVVVHDLEPARIEELRRAGADGAGSHRELVDQLTPQRVVLLMLPAGEPTEALVQGLAGLLASGDILIDGGNGFFRDDVRRAASLAPRGIRYLDAGVSGGIWGLKEGYCTMVGGEKEAFQHIEPLLRDLAPPGGYLHCGPAGAGHFLKMVHNGIEYALMEAYAEGFELLEASPYAQSLDFAGVAALWNRGSVIRSWLLELLEGAFRKDSRLERIRGHVEDTGEGRWTVQQAVESGVQATAIAHALFRRFDSRKPDPFGNRVLAALRAEFGGHAVKKA